MLIYKGDKYNKPLHIGKGVVYDLAMTKFRQTEGRTIDRLNTLNKMFEGVKFNIKNNKLVVIYS